jgi:hypothetical protein
LGRNYEGGTQIARKLQPAIAELEEVGFLEPLSEDERFTKKGREWSIRFMQKAPALPALPTAANDAQPEPPGLVVELAKRGVTKATATELVQRHSAEAIESKIEVFDWLTEKQDKRVAKSPAGYLVTSIEKDYAAPKGFVSKAERMRREEAKQQAEQKAAEDRRRQQEEEARARAEQEAADAYWASLSAEQQSRLEADALADGGDEARQIFETMNRIRGGSGYRTLLRRAYIIKLLRESRLPPAEA